ncbi:11871_t:CDS:2 [Diversispora eburnea]|uniref:11871_t:CDS:1 n=1 Tax=Diversispora eburnea TaxID=1213867 RepID=A0A9N8VEX3_9GLOM|nr:11871_t:CDS:2 [Diversispora eburnea]
MQQIFQNIVDQGEALYPLLLVNRYWCKNVVPFLWSRPFENLLPENRFKIMCIYLSSLDEQEQLILSSALKHYDINLPKIQKPLFNYPILLKEFSFKNLEMIVHSFVYRWSCDHCTIKDLDEQMNIITSSLCKLFLKHSTSLRSFKLDKFLTHCDIPECNNIFDYNFNNFNNIYNNFSDLLNISKLEIDYTTTPIMKNSIQILNIISKLCKRIRILDVKIPPFTDKIPEITKGIIKIIRSQECLKEFNLEGVDSEESKEIILALRTQAATLNIVKFENINLTTSSLLSLTYCTNLEILSMLNSSGEDSLQDITFDVITHETINSIIQNCPNIRNLTLLNYQPRQHNPLLNSLFLNLIHITHLTLQINHKNMSYENMIISGKNLPPNLEYLKLKCGFTSVQLDGLLNDCGENAKLKVLIIDFMKVLYMDLKVIMKFVKCRRTLKYLGINGRVGWGGKEMKELEVLKEKFGVHVIPWYEVDKW